MSEHVRGKSCVHDYKSAWLSRWTQRGNGFELNAHCNRDAKFSTKVNLPKDGRLLKETTGSMKLNGKMLSGCLDLFPNLDSAVQSVEKVPDMNKEPPIVADRENSIDGEEGETSSSATKRMNVIDLLNDNTKLFKECKRVRLDLETNSSSQVKRLKINASSDHGGNETKKSMMVLEEGPSGKTGNAFFYRILKCGINKPGSRRNQKPFPSGIKHLKMGEKEDFTVQNPWIQRWCTKKAAQTHEQERGQKVNPKGTVLEKQFPSIAAMALMAKSLRRFKPEWS